MLPPAGLAAGLAVLPNWLHDATDATAFDALLGGWARACGWKSAGVCWPADGKPLLSHAVRGDATDPAALPPAELADAVRGLKAGSATVVWRQANGAPRLYTLLHPPGRPAGVAWADRGPSDSWAEAERNFLVLSARLIERSPAFTAKVGPLVDSRRLLQRLGDSAVVAGRMAHDFDNILTGIIGFADLTAALVPAGSQPAKYLAEISKVGHRGVQFTQQLHQLSRSGNARPHPGSVAAAVAKEEARLRAVAPPGVAIQVDVPANLALVAMEAAPLAAAVGHLMENAVEASPADGRVGVSARAVEVTAADAKTYLGPVSPGPHVQVTVTDHGPGIKPEVRARLFAEPFYTTKVRHRGLGLAVAFRTVAAHGGGILIDPPAPDGGTTVRLVIPPAAVRPPLAQSPTTGAPTARPAHTTTLIGG